MTKHNKLTNRFHNKYNKKVPVCKEGHFKLVRIDPYYKCLSVKEGHFENKETGENLGNIVCLHEQIIDNDMNYLEKPIRESEDDIKWVH